ncbi:MAG: hypothetical protein IJ568_04770 [Bacilli bacterium]|nr:hypothetical protein [Bacilli bacterium]
MQFLIIKYNILKGDDLIKNIILKFIGTGLLDNYQAHVKVFDNEKTYYCGNSYNGEVQLSLEKNKVYRLYAVFRNQIVNSAFYVTDQKIYTFYFNNIIYIPRRIVTFQLNDFYYNIPIMKGEILLGKNN